MSAQWMVYAVAVGLVVTLAALVAEQGMRLARRAGRWIWALAMVVSVVLPWLTTGALDQLAPLERSAGPARAALLPTLVLSGFPATPALAARAWLPVRTAPADGVQIDIDQVARRVALLGSLLAAALLLGSSLALRRRQRCWRRGVIAGTPVLVSVDAGPAVIGLLRAQIVVPGWLLHADPRQQTLILAHEQAHIEAGDQRLLALVALLLVAMPWNLALWYQLRRLRLSIEVDCDARVLARGHRLADYGAALIDVGSHAARSPTPRLAVITPALTESAGFLEQRLRLMTRRPARWHRVVAPVLLLAAFDIGVVAARIAPPQGAHAAQVAKVVLPSRQALAGYYQLDAYRIAIVTVAADGLELAINAESRWRLLPEAEDRYFVPATGLRARFDRSAGTLTLSGLGVATQPASRVAATAVERADAWVAARVASQQPLPAGEAIVRRNIGARTVGELHAADFTPGFLRQAVASMPQQRAFNEANGQVQAVTFDGVDRAGWDCYKVRYATRSVTWAIWLDTDGKLAAARPVAARR